MTLLGLLLLPLASRPSEGAEITAFVATATPNAAWGRGYGGALTMTFFNMVSFEGEAAHLPTELRDAGNMTSFSASALISPPFGFVTPYGGLSVGLFRQESGSRSDTGKLRAFVVGVKVKLAGLLVVKGDYRRLSLSGEPLLPVENRFALGAGISF